MDDEFAGDDPSKVNGNWNVSLHAKKDFSPETERGRNTNGPSGEHVSKNQNLKNQMNEKTNAIQRREQVAVTKPKALEVMAGRLNVDPTKLLGTLKATVFKNATDDEIVALVVVSNEYALNPLLKEIYAFPAKGGGIVPVVSIDGWIKITNRAEHFDGIEFEFIESDQNAEGPPIACTATIFLKNRTRPVKVTEYFDECARKTEPWDKMPRRMLRHKALIQCARVAFGFSGIHDEDEAIDIAAVVVEAPRVHSVPKTAIPENSGKTPQSELAETVVSAGYDFNLLQKWGMDTGNIEGADSLTSFEEIPAATATRLLRAKTGLLSGLAQLKEAK